MAGVGLQLFRQGRTLGEPTLANDRAGRTDDAGEYVIENVDPGRYYLYVMAGAGRVMMGAGTGVSGKTLGDQFYGGARNAKDASPVIVRGGEALAGLDIRLTSETLISIRGRVVGVPDEVQPNGQQNTGPAMGRGIGNVVEVIAEFVGSGPQNRSRGVGVTGPERQFEFRDLPPGRYRLSATYRANGKLYGSSQVFDFVTDPGEVVLTLVPAVDIRGTLRVEGQPPPNSAQIFARAPNGGYSVRLIRPNSARNNLMARVRQDGSFTLEQVLPGEWQMDVTPVPPGYLKSARLGDKDVRFAAFETGDSSVAALSVVVSMHAGTVIGKVDAKAPAAEGAAEPKRAGIVLAPVGANHNLLRYYYGGAADDEGKFKLAGIAPGKYKVFALENMAAANFRNPEAIDPLDALGAEIVVGEDGITEAHPKLIPMARAAQVLP